MRRAPDYPLYSPPTKELSVVVPAYHGADTIVSDVCELERTIASLVGDSYEILLVVDGDAGTMAAAHQLSSPHVSVMGYKTNRGKGFAIAYGMRFATGRLIGFMDSGGDIDPGAWTTLLALQRERNADAVIGSKRHPASKVDFPPVRRLYSLLYQIAVRLLFRIRVRDTQTGIKVYKRELIRTVAPLLLVKRFAFDIEILAVGHHLGFRSFVEAPVSLKYQFSSSVNLGAVVDTLWDTAAVFYRLYVLRYYDRRFRQQTAAPQASGSPFRSREEIDG